MREEQEILNLPFECRINNLINYIKKINKLIPNPQDLYLLLIFQELVQKL